MDFQPICEGWGETREGGRAWAEAALLHATHFRAATVRSYSIEDVKEALLVLVEHHFKVGCAAPAKITRSPFNVKLPVRRGARGRGEHPAATRETGAVGRHLIGAQIVLIREDSLAYIAGRQGTVCAQITRIARELQIAIGAD